MTSVETSVNDMSSKISGFETTIDTRHDRFVEMKLSEISSDGKRTLASVDVQDSTGPLTRRSPPSPSTLGTLINGISRMQRTVAPQRRS